jgi:hypothetical protein
VLRKRLAVLVAAAMVLVMAASPAWAAKGGFPTEGTCGLGKRRRRRGLRTRVPQGQASSRGSLPQRQVAPVTDRTAEAGPELLRPGPASRLIHPTLGKKSLRTSRDRVLRRS